MMRHERQADESARERKEQLEISGVRRIAECHVDAIVAPRDLHLMRRGIWIAELGGAVDLQAEAAGRSLPIAIAEVAEAPRIARPVEQLRDLSVIFRVSPGLIGKTRARMSPCPASSISAGSRFWRTIAS